MHTYSKKIVLFIKEITSMIRQIITGEIGLRISGEYFYDRFNTRSYPINVVIFNDKKMLGYFNSHFYELGFHEALMHTNKIQLRNIIRHELAHYMTFISFGPYVQPHGGQFRAFCERMGWSKEVYGATTCLDDGALMPAIEDSGVMRKVQKLMGLSSSSNRHEAEQAMIKSQQLLLKHNIDTKYIENDDEKFYLKRILKQKKNNAKMHSIGSILTTFFVNVVYSRYEDATYLEIVGSAVNVEIAEYVGDFLNNELERLWDNAKRQHKELSGKVAKNSFFYGIATGYCEKINALKAGYDNKVSYALMVIEKKLVDAKEMAYKRLTTTRSNGSYCSDSAMIGENIGKNLSINPALNGEAKRSQALLTHF